MRKPKSPLSAWIVQQRQAQDPPWKSEELAKRLGVVDSTVRGWEAGRSVSPQNIEALERLFGVTAPGHTETGQDALIAAIEANTAMLERVLMRLGGLTPDDEPRGALAEYARQGPAADAAPRVPTTPRVDRPAEVSG